MLKNYFKTAWRNLSKNRISSFINISGLAVGMAVAMLIGLWIYDELSYEKYYKNYESIAKVMLTQTVNGTAYTKDWIPIPLEGALKKDYGRYFSHLALWHGAGKQILTKGDNKFTKAGYYVEPEFPEIFSLKMLKGTRKGLNDPSSILLSASVAHMLFGDADPINQVLKVNNKLDVKVSGVYEDLPYNSELRDVTFLLPWVQFVADQGWVEHNQDNWGLTSFGLFAEIAPNNNFRDISAKIEQIKATHAKDEAKFSPKVFLQPASQWHLYSDFKDGVNVGGRITYVWLFGIIGAFVLLLACINFMNLSTARSEKRAKEVGIRKAIGSLRSQLIWQFFSESLLVAVVAFLLSLILVQVSLPFFNQVADKKMSLLWGSPLFWLLGIGFSLVTGLIAGSYPAFYLSAFRPVKVLKGTFTVGRMASLPRKVLVVTQFTVSVMLIIGTIVVLNQIRFAKNRPVGYDRAGLLNIQMNTPDISGHYDAIRSELLQTGAVVNMSESSSPTTELFSNDTGLDWAGKDPGLEADFGVVACTHDYGKTVGWQIKEGRDFSRNFPTDSFSLIMNESAVKFMGLKKPIGESIKWHGRNYKLIGVIKDIVMSSPFDPVKPTVFFISYEWANFITIRLNPDISAGKALGKIEAVLRKYNPAAPFEYKFLDGDYNEKFSAEDRIGTLAGFFATLAILISCLGLFGMASFMAEQRIKEIGVRKVLGASVFNVWRLLSKDFVVLVIISLLIATPTAYYFMHNWLQNYQYRTGISWWVFAVAGFGALMITLLTVSYQAIKAAIANPVKSLRTE